MGNSGNTQQSYTNLHVFISTDVRQIINFNSKVNYMQDGNTYFITSDELNCTVKLDIADKYCTLTKSDNTSVDTTSVGY